MNPIPSSQSRTNLTSLVLPPDTNHYDNIFGGKILAYIDEVAAIAAMKHCKRAVVTASIDSVDFLHPVKIGYTISVEAFVAYTGRSSMEISAQVTSAKLQTGEKLLTTTSFITMVAVDEQGKSLPVPPLLPESELEKELYQTAPQRQETRKQRKNNNSTHPK